MKPTLSNDPASPLRERLEPLRPKMAKVRQARAKPDLKNVETDSRQQIGQAIQRCFSLAGVTQKEASGLVHRDQAQVARWISGAERPQLDALFAVEQLRQPLIVAFAEMAGEGVDVTTIIQIRRSA